LGLIIYLAYWLLWGSNSFFIGFILTSTVITIGFIIHRMVNKYYRNYPEGEFDEKMKRINLKHFLKNIGVEIGLVYLFLTLLILMTNVADESNSHAFNMYWDGFFMGCYFIGMIWMCYFNVFKKYHRDYTKYLEEYLKRKNSVS